MYSARHRVLSAILVWSTTRSCTRQRNQEIARRTKPKKTKEPKEPKKSKKSKKSKQRKEPKELSKSLSGELNGRSGDSAEDRSGPPPFKNLRNMGGTCYLSSAGQIMARVPCLRGMFDDPASLPTIGFTGRAANTWDLERDDGGLKHSALVSTLFSLVLESDGAGDRLPWASTNSLLEGVRQLRPQYGNRENDAGDVFLFLLGVLNITGDKSKPLVLGETTLARLAADQENRIKQGLLLKPLEEEVEEQLCGFLETGNDSTITDLFGIQVVRESVCRVDDCISPFSRSWEVSLCLLLSWPRDENRKIIKQVCGVPELLRQWQTELFAGLGSNDDDALGLQGRECGADLDHPRRRLAERKITRTPKVLAMRVERAMGEIGEIKGDLLDREDVIKNPLHLEEYLDLHQFCAFQLPSEQAYGDSGIHRKLLTMYRIAAVIQWQGRHYKTFARVPD